MILDSGSRVLIAEGDVAVRRALFATLLEMDVFSDSVANGRQALERLAERPYMVVLLDLDVPGPDAHQILKMISTMVGDRRPIVIAFANAESARSMDVEIVQIVLRKPIDVRQTAEVVRSCVRTAAMKRRLAGITDNDEDVPGDQLTS